MKKIDKNLIEKLSSDLMLTLTDDEVKDIEANIPIFTGYIQQLQSIDTDGVEAMNYPFDAPTSWLRDDVVSHVIDQELAFENAPTRDGDYFEIVKVVNK